MGRPSSQQRVDAIELIRRHCNEHGIKEGCRLAREQMPNVPRGTWGRWRIDAVGMQPEQEDREQSARAAVGREVRDIIPAVGELLPVPADVVPAQRRALDFWRMLNELDDDAALMREYAVTTTPEGKRKLRVPFALATAHKMRADLIRLAMEHASVAWSVERNRQFQDVVIEAIAEISPDMQRLVIERLRKLNHEFEARYGVL
jgi:hypothetical protein